jgi:NAD+-dependent protein deacetylase sirtuin 4
MDFQRSLSELNPLWAAFLAELLEAGALDTENPEERRKRGLKTNPDGDVDLPDAPYSTFRYPACPACLEKPPLLPDGTRSIVEIDADRAWSPISTAGILKPAVVMFGESIPEKVKVAAEEAIDTAGRILVVGSSLATYSAWRLVKRATERGLPLGILNLGGVRGEEAFFAGIRADNDGALGIRCNERADKLLPMVVESLRSISVNHFHIHENKPVSLVR